MQETKYNIGLDIGTNSVGWAVVRSDNFNIIRKGGKKLWGVRLFEEAKTAADRRLFRSDFCQSSTGDTGWRQSDPASFSADCDREIVENCI